MKYIPNFKITINIVVQINKRNNRKYKSGVVGLGGIFPMTLTVGQLHLAVHFPLTLTIGQLDFTIHFPLTSQRWFCVNALL